MRLTSCPLATTEPTLTDDWSTLPVPLLLTTDASTSIFWNVNGPTTASPTNAWAVVVTVPSEPSTVWAVEVTPSMPWPPLPSAPT